jgi:hypothetical protein
MRKGLSLALWTYSHLTCDVVSGMQRETKDAIGVAVWGLAGAIATLGVVSLGATAWFASAGLVIVATAAKLPVRVDALLFGTAVPLLVIALGNASGPGWSCHSGPAESGCDELLDPRPFLSWGVVLLGLGVAVRAALRRHPGQQGASGTRARPGPR